MAKEYLDKDGVLYFWQKIKTWVAGKIPTKVSQLTNDSGFTTNPGTITGVSVNGSSVATSGTANVTVPTAASATPKMDGTAAAGSESAFARGDHVHPTDTSRASASDLSSHTSNTTVHVTAAERSSWNAKQSALSFDSTPTADSTKPVTSDGIKDALDKKVDKVSGKGLSTNDYTSAEKTKLAGIASGANNYSLPTASASALGGVKVGSNLSIQNGVLSGTPDTTYSDMKGATTSAGGTHGLVPAPAMGSATRYLRSDGTWAVPPDTNTTYSLATTSANGLMSYMDKARMDAFDIKYSESDSTLPVEINYIDIADAETNNVQLVNYESIGTSICPLNDSKKIDSQYLPSYVDDVVEAYPVSGATALARGWLSETSGGSALTPEAGKIYILMADSGDYTTNSQFRWSGSTYVKLADGGVSSITNAEIDTIIAS